MALFDLYSKRLKRSQGEMPDVYQYKDIPVTLRHQIIYILRDGIGDSYYGNSTYREIEEIFLREHGLGTLGGHSADPDNRLFNYLLNAPSEHVLDLLELGMFGVTVHSPDTKVAKLTDELNTRFRDAGVGYKIENQRVFRIDSEFIHSEVVKPALAILTGKHLAGARDEFLSAHAHYRAGNHKECLNDCLKAFESTMKGICARRKWTHDPKATAKVLLDLLFDKGLVPQLIQSHFSGLRATLEAGVPTVRNKLAGHGQGPTPVQVPQSFASYALHLTATNIVFLANLDSESP